MADVALSTLIGQTTVASQITDFAPSVLATALTGYTVGTNTALAASDTLVGAFQKVQAQLNNKQASGSYAAASHTHTTADITALTSYTLGTNTAIAAADSLNTALGKIQAQINNKQNSGAYEPAITGGTSAQYWNGSKSWTDFDTSVRAAVLTGYAVGTNTALAATDTVLGAFQKLQGQLNNKQASGSYEPTIAAAGNTTSYWRGDKSWQTLNTAAVPESGNLYFTDARAIAAVLTGYAVGSNTAVAATDTILGAIQKIQGQLNNKQASGSYAASSHTHTASNITDFASSVIGTALTGYAVGSNTALAASDTILGAFQKIQAQLNNKQASGSYAAATHTHAISDITNLQTTLNGKADLASGPTFAGDIRTYRTGATTTGVIYFGQTGSNYLYYDGANHVFNGGQVYVGGNIVYHSGSFTVSSSAGNSTVVQRSGNGYIYCNYINSTADVIGAVDPSHVAVMTGSDSFMRWHTWGNFTGRVHAAIGGNYASSGHSHSSLGALTVSNLTTSGDVTINSPGTIYCYNWYRSYNDTGWYNATYAGGIYMTDTTYVRAYNGKAMAASDFANTSDQKFKTEVDDLRRGGRLVPRVFKWIADNRWDIGFIAQEVQKVWPELVNEVEDKEKGNYLVVSYAKATAVLAMQLNDVADDLDVLKRKVASLEAELEAFRNAGF